MQRQVTRGKITEHDVIAAMLSFLGEKTERFQADPKVINEAVFELKGKFPQLLERFAFSTDAGDLYPFSPLLERVLARLQLSRIITMENPDWTTFIIRPAAKEYIRQHILTAFSEDEKNQLKTMAQVLEEKTRVLA